MNSNEIRQLANKAGFDTGLKRDGSPVVWTLFKDGDNFYNEIERFAKLVAAKEREACLKICEAQAQTNYWEGADVCAEEIRARGHE